MLSADRASWQNWRVLAMLSLVFVCGALAGALTMRAGLHTSLHRMAMGRVERSQLTYERLTKDLNLSSEQADQLKSILDDMFRYHQDLDAQIEDVRATGKNRIRQILNAQQRQDFERICNELPAL
jgi:septal ring factor EnvC (AmiA/AmiB activator)